MSAATTPAVPESRLRVLADGSLVRTELVTPGMCGQNSLFVGQLGDLPESERQSVETSLERLKRQSIGRAIRELAAQLGVEAAEDAGLAVGSGEVVRLLGALPPNPGSGDVVVSLDTPYALAESSATTAKIALYGRTPDAFRALVDVLTGAASAGGRLPVDVPGVQRDGC